MKTQHWRVFLLLSSIGLILILPLFGALMHEGGSLPPGFFDYPPYEPREVAGFSWIAFTIIAVLFLGMALIYLIPGWFGFKKVPVPDEPPPPKVKFPIWFWAGVILWGVPIVLLFAKVPEPQWLLYYSDLPLFWGFTLLLDGIVYKRTGGRSIIGQHPIEMVGIGSASVSGWMLFEFLNFYVKMNWYYPFGELIPRSYFLLYALIGSSGLLPMAFEWYDLLLTFKVFRKRFSSGWSLSFPKWLKIFLLVMSFAGMFFMGLYPEQLYTTLWLWPVIIFSVLLSLMNIWTPFTPLKQGDWNPLLVFALAYLFQGIAMEGWNYFSGIHENGEVILTYSPAYWAYNIPYVERFHIFEMPLVGYLGYLPFSVYCWIWWIVYAYLQGIHTKHCDHTESYKRVAE